MVVVVEPAVKGFGAFGAVAVDGAVGPVGEQGADKALGFAVGLWAVGPGAPVANAQRSAGDSVNGLAIGRAVVGQQLLDGDAVAVIKGNGATKEGDRE